MSTDSTMARKTLAEQIAELAKPKSDYDIEDDERAGGFSSGSEKSDDEAPLHYVPVEKSKLRKESALLKDKKYSGQVASRDSLYGQQSDTSERSEGEDGLSEVSGGEEGMSEDDMSESEPLEAESEKAKTGGDNDSQSDESDRDNNEDNDENDNVAASKIKNMMANEKKHIILRLSESAANDATKGFAILQQHKEFDALIDARLKIQKALTESNLLPSKAAETPDLQPAKDTCFALLDAIHKLRGASLRRDGVIAEEKTPKKRSLAEYARTTETYDSALEAYRGTVLTKWLAKIQNSLGASAMNANKFKALNQSAEQQVVNNLSDMDRLVKRTKLNRRKITPMGHESEKEQESGREEEQGQSRELNIQEIDSIYDDEDFYRVLLNDLVDKKIQSSDPTSGLQFALKGAAAGKLKKNVDNKASKGRRLRYHVHEKLANFDTPKPWVKWTDDHIDEFFASLLGQKVSMKEESDSESESEVELEADSVKLFG